MAGAPQTMTASCQGSKETKMGNFPTPSAMECGLHHLSLRERNAVLRDAATLNALDNE